MVNFQPRFLQQLLLITPLIVLVSLFSRSHLLAETAFTGCGGELVSATNTINEARVIELVNEQRAANGLPPMKLNTDLANAARYHAADMKQDDYFNHQTQDRSNGALVRVCSWSDRIKRYYTVYNGLAENIAYGYDSPESVMTGWMNSSGHRANILGNYREIGVGFFDNYWVQDFGDRSNNYPVIINREAAQTDSPQVKLYIYGAWQQMRLRNDDDSWCDWRTFAPEVTWNLRNVGGERRVEVELSNGATSVTSSDTIVLAGTAAPTATPTPVSTPVPAGSFFIYLPTVKR